MGDTPAGQIEVDQSVDRQARGLTALWECLPLIWVLALIPHAVAVGLAAHRITGDRTLGNLTDFRAAAMAMLHGQDIYSSGGHAYVYPPMIAFLYQPLAMVSVHAAAWVLLVVNASLSVLTLVLVSSQVQFRVTGSADRLSVARVALVTAWLTVDKIRAEFNMWETNVLMLLMFTLGMRWVDKRPWLSGMALGFAFNIKYLPIVLVPYLALRRRWQVIGWFFVWAVFFGVLPSLSLGWHGDAVAWAKASGGIARLFGVTVNVENAANLLPLASKQSISIPSTIARWTGLSGFTPILIAGVFGLTFVVWAAWTYRRARFPVLRWPARSVQFGQPFRGLLSIEWIGIILLTLTFSPNTNTRHLYMLLDVNAAGAVLLLSRRGGVNYRPLLVATILLAVGLTFPPGGERFRASEKLWQAVGGVSWCMLVMYAALVWTNVRYLRAGLTKPIAAVAGASSGNGRIAAEAALAGPR